jgi:hypothetical protein
MILKVELPYNKLLIGIILSIIPLYIGMAIFTILFVLLVSINIASKGDVKKAIVFYLMLTFLLPYDFIHLATKSYIGLIFNEYFIAGLPLYMLLPRILTINSIGQKLSRNHKIIFYGSIIILLYSNVIPGFLSIFGLGGHVVRLVFLFNFINSVILCYFLFKTHVDKEYILILSKYIIVLGFIVSLLGIFQYLFHLSIIPNIGEVDYNRLFIISSSNSVDCVPFLLVPMVFALSSILNSRKVSLQIVVVFVTIFLAILFTWSRWALLVSAILIMYAIYIYRRRLKKAFAMLLILALITPIVAISISSTLNLESQNDRLNSASNFYVRTYLWGLGLTAVINNPVLGYGFGNSVDAMFSQESNYVFFYENYNKSTKTFNKQSVHQFILDYMMSLGGFFLIPLMMMFSTIVIRSNYSSKVCRHELRFFYIAILLSTLGLFLFWLQNVGSQMFYLYFFLGIISKKIPFIKQNSINVKA